MSHDLHDEVCPGIDVKTGARDGAGRITDGSLTGYRLGLRVIRVDVDEVDSLLKLTPAAGMEW